MNTIEVYDIECLANFHSYYGLNINTQEECFYIIHDSQNDLEAYITHLKGLQGMIGFNNLSYDSQVLEFLIKNYNTFKSLSGDQIAKAIYQESQRIIDVSNSGGFPGVPEWKLSIAQLDLFKIMHFDNKAKSTSLKWVEYMIDMPSIKEMPLKHYEYVQKDSISDIIHYNRNDVIATYNLYNLVIGKTDHSLYKGIDKCSLRKDVTAEFGINCRNYNDVRIGDEINKVTYCTNKGIDKRDVPKPDKKALQSEVIYFKDCFPPYMKFETIEFNNFVKSISNIQIKDEKQRFEFTHNETIYTIAKGGMHSVDKPRKILPKLSEILMDADVGGQYPWSIIKRKLYPRHLGDEWLIGYESIYKKRSIAKKEGKLSISEAFKLANNGGGFGKTKEETSWQYDPLVTMKTTIGNQMELLMLIEKLEINGIHVVSANTDGIVSLFSNTKLDLYYQLCRDWEIQVGNNILGNLEYTEYDFIAQSSVNDYLAKTKEGKIKKKGDFMTDFELHKNKSKRIVPLALQEYFTKNVKPEEFIKKHDNIYDFCLGVKAKGGIKVIAFDKGTLEEKELQKINRYYISNSGVNLLKRLPVLDTKHVSHQIDIFGNVDDGTREHELESGQLSTVFNNYEKKDMKDYDINYQYYINCTNKIIKQIEHGI